MRARKRAQRTIVKQAALDVIKLKKAGGKYGCLTKVIKQYGVYGITRVQLKHAVNKIEKNEVQEVSQYPAAVLLGGTILPMSILTSERSLDNPIATAALHVSMPIAATTTATTPPRRKGGRPKGTTYKAKIQKTKKIQAILVETSDHLIESQKEAN